MFKHSILKSFFSSIKFSQSKIISSPAKDYFNVVSDVANYKNFLPWCSESKIISSQNEDNFDARLTINFKVYKACYISTVNMKRSPDCYNIVSRIERNNPIFNFLVSQWHIKELGQGKCEMRYDVEFEFRNFIYQQVSEYFIDIVGEKMTNAFEKRLFDEKAKNAQFVKNNNIVLDEKAKPVQMLKKISQAKEQNDREIKRKSALISTHSEILESLKLQIGQFYKLHEITDGEFISIMEIIDKNLDLKEFLIQAYVLFCNNRNCKNGESKLLSYLKDISLMKIMKVSN